MISGLLKTTGANSSKELPIKLFECSKIYLKDINAMKVPFAACYAGITDGFEIL